MVPRFRTSHRRWRWRIHDDAKPAGRRPSVPVLLALVLASSLGSVSARKADAKNPPGEVHAEAAEKFKAIPSTFLDTGAVAIP